jgi:hypothetical protein
MEREMISPTDLPPIESLPEPPRGYSSSAEYPRAGLHGLYRDALAAPDGRLIWDRGWKSNTIVGDCGRLLAGFLHGGGVSLGIQGLWLGQGNAAWDVTGPPAPAATQTALVDPFPFLAPLADLETDFLTGATVTATATNRLQIKATLGPNVPPWPDSNHVVANLREFGLVGQIAGVNTLINYVTHPVIVKDPSSTLTRTILLVF